MVTMLTETFIESMAYNIRVENTANLFHISVLREGGVTLPPFKVVDRSVVYSRTWRRESVSVHVFTRQPPTCIQHTGKC